MNAIILFGHGSRSPQWIAPFEHIRAAILAREPNALVEFGFLELMRPSFAEAVDGLVAQGATHIAVVPVFMASGGHVLRDLPQLAEDAGRRHAGLVITISLPVGEVETVIEAIARHALDQYK